MFVFFSLKVTYANEGTYVLKDWLGRELSMIDVSVTGESASAFLFCQKTCNVSVFQVVVLSF